MKRGLLVALTIVCMSATALVPQALSLCGEPDFAYAAETQQQSSDSEEAAGDQNIAKGEEADQGNGQTAQKVKTTKVKISVSAANKKQYLRNTGSKWTYYPVKYNGKGWSHASTMKDIRKKAVFKGGKNYDVKWDKAHKTTTVKFTLSKKVKGQYVVIKDSCRHRTWKKTKPSKVFTKTIRPSGKTIKYRFDKKLLQYENHSITVTSYSKAGDAKAKTGVLKLHIHVKDKGEQVVDTAMKYRNRVRYSGGRRNSINSSAKSLKWLETHKPKVRYADCSSFVSKIYNLHGLWSGSRRLSNLTWTMGKNAGHRPKGMKSGIKRAYKNMGCVWLVNDYESGHRWAHTAIIIGDNYYISVTDHEERNLSQNACIQKCTNGSRNYGVKEVYDYRSW